MLENILWAVFGFLAALSGVMIVYIKNSQKILHLTNAEQKLNSGSSKKNRK